MVGIKDDIVTLFLKLIPSIVSGSGASVCIYTGGHRVFSGYANKHNITAPDKIRFESDLLEQWAWNIITGPIDKIFDSQILIALFIVTFFILVYLLLKHLLSGPSGKTQTVYQKKHHIITLLIYMVLALLVVIPTNSFVFILSLILFLVFSISHLFLRVNDLQNKSSINQKILYLISFFGTLVVIYLVPTSYGNSYFSPTVWYFAIDTKENIIQISNSETVQVYFSEPKWWEGGITVGRLKNKNLEGKSSVREFTAYKITGPVEAYPGQPSATSILLKDLLEYDFETRVNEDEAERVKVSVLSVTEKLKKLTS